MQSSALIFIPTITVTVFL